jgi:hypothetical protein
MSWFPSDIRPEPWRSWHAALAAGLEAAGLASVSLGVALGGTATELFTDGDPQGPDHRGV